jgi:adenylylsulfate kinase-like enzyme
VNDVILIAGMPASGKTSFGDYLRDKKHFLHVDLKAFDGSYFRSGWNASLSVGRLEVFLETLKRHATRAVLTWGFHTNNLGIVRALKAKQRLERDSLRKDTGRLMTSKRRSNGLTTTGRR